MPSIPGITSLSVTGFKSLRDRQRIDIKPLTILAGVNSSGKSSIIQPLLLLKQTLDAPYDPGPLLLNGPNVSVTRIEQVLSRGEAGTEQAEEFEISFTIGEDDKVNFRFGRNAAGDIVNKAGFLNKYISDGHGRAIRRIIHLPALRGNPVRTYRTTAVEDVFPGVFNDYTAGVIAAWQSRKQTEHLARLRADLEMLGLTSDVSARKLDDASVELLVGRLPRARRGSQDLVNIADVGFGVSQTLPVVVALQVAAPGQLVYLEQPEIHLHPRAQAAFAELLRAAAERGARVVVETHSALLIRAVQTMVAKGSMDGDDVALHWFSRSPETGLTTITSATLDRFGSFGDWPEDFDEVNLRSDHEYLTAVERAEARENPTR